jgi:DNA-binding transcriptional regulator YiaG
MTTPRSIRALTERAPVTDLPEPAERAQLRDAFGVSQAELAAALSVARQTVITWEKGTHNPVGKKRALYAQILDSWKTELQKRDAQQ